MPYKFIKVIGPMWRREYEIMNNFLIFVKVVLIKLVE